ALSGDVQFHQWDQIPLPATAAGIQAQIMWPPAPASTWSTIADSSIAVRLSYGTTDYCFQGDIETAQEASLASEARDLNCEVYLIGHHGSRYASSNAWLTMIHPTYAPVSFGTNTCGHPTSEALCRVQTAGASVFATHRLGD